MITHFNAVWLFLIFASDRERLKSSENVVDSLTVESEKNDGTGSHVWGPALN